MARHLTLSSIILVAAIALSGCSDDGKKQAGGPGGPGGAGGERPPSPVSVLAIKKSTAPLTTILSGRAEAFQTADIRPRVGGVIKEIAFKEGSFVKAGDLLYKIDEDTYRASLDEAKATLEKSEASVPAAEANLQRYERLANTGASQKEYEDAQTTLLQAKASVSESRASLQTAQINLDLTSVKAPFDGVTSATNYSIGNVVTASQTDSLMTLRQINPIYIKLNESSVNLLRLRAAIKAGNLKRNSGGADADTTDIRLTMEDGTEYPHVGKIDMSEMAVSTTTGTVSVRTLFDNPDDLILPGMYVRATITVGEEEGYLIPQRAASRNANGDLTAKFVNSDNKVETRTFPSSKLSGNSWLVNDGVKDGDQLILDGFQSITDNATVKPVPAQIDSKGFVIAPAAGKAATEAPKS
ncbi:efflux RND transporter periplasmic adaptor subunit [Agrobacterium vitis]|uniref:Efflux RND transporter periplasmic adaptor subunit n=1 Tax=Agrobacterium vitis TaxID=373 RepID=A0A368NGW3_AGRVI|nr:efflux RND transporter periplasmic adaptor subunit [Agrobacterium vitis]KAA3508852.1 efflux RND transporter periplasmic adaptor subunit [Agrobacterium vitis]KAA3521928.1 efflux RND transporter periplasmic adaptor subunit [Agrobacterium vitis]MCF1479849.1 efflux RND transporter periplasmic adaptor subunit [Agrobacterium vitis]MUZ74625.1 efflux RND transporter periplasmic adaptor subunit [Agrobacterium vitis]MUZ99825.1 efflux RND transporter periplasmic adaptor subunit [Agrobacterium vitis]